MEASDKVTIDSFELMDAIDDIGTKLNAVLNVHTIGDRIYMWKHHPDSTLNTKNDKPLSKLKFLYASDVVFQIEEHGLKVVKSRIPHEQTVQILADHGFEAYF